MIGSSKGRETSTRRLEKRVKELEEKLASSIPKAEFDAFKSNLQLEIDDLQKMLSDSVPRADLDYVKNELQRICDLEGRLTSVRSEETEELRARISELEKLLRLTLRPDTEQDSQVLTEKIQALDPKLSESVPREEPEASEMEVESRFTELQQALSESKREADALREKISELQSRPATADEPATQDSKSTDSEDHEIAESEDSESTESYSQSEITD